jgi:hypothetical protein
VVRRQLRPGQPSQDRLHLRSAHRRRTHTQPAQPLPRQPDRQPLHRGHRHLRRRPSQRNHLGTVGYFASVTPSGVNGCATSGTSRYCTANALPTGYTLRPNIVPGVPLVNKNWKKNALNPSFTPYLNPAAFSVPGSLNDPQLGNAPRLLSGARSPREALFDMQFSKGFKFGERYGLKINSNFINAFNHPVYYGVSHSLLSSNTVSNVTGTVTPVTSASFGQFNQSQTAGMSRVIQVGAEFTF